MTLSEAVERFLAELRLSNAEEVRAALARLLAESIEEAPAYARAKIGAELRACLVELEEPGRAPGRAFRSVRPAAQGTTYVSRVPSTVPDIFAAASASPAGVVRWGTPPAPPAPRTAPATGIYVVALTDKLESRAGALGARPRPDWPSRQPRHQAVA